jgi:hypothetical protein
VRGERDIYTWAKGSYGLVGPMEGEESGIGWSEWMGKYGGGGIRDACQVMVGLLCVEWLAQKNTHNKVL